MRCAAGPILTLPQERASLNGLVCAVGPRPHRAVDVWCDYVRLGAVLASGCSARRSATNTKERDCRPAETGKELLPVISMEKSFSVIGGGSKSDFPSVPISISYRLPA